jgi:hypothetical protein
MMVVITFVHYDSNQTVLPCGFGVLDWFEEKVVEDIVFVKDVIKKPVLDLNITHIFDVYNKEKITGNLFSKSRVPFIHVIRIKHLMSFISAEIKSFLQVDITETIKVNDSSKPDFMICFFVFGQINSLAFLFGRWVAKSSGVDKNVFWQSLDRNDLLFVLDVEGVKVPP